MDELREKIISIITKNIYVPGVQPTNEVYQAADQILAILPTSKSNNKDYINNSRGGEQS